MSTDQTKSLIAIVALNKMFEGSHFSICTIDNVASMLGVIPDKEAYTQLRTLHCIDWKDMPKELRNRVPGLIQQVLSGDQTFRFELAQPASQALTVIDGSPHTRRPLLKRMFG